MVAAKYQLKLFVVLIIACTLFFSQAIQAQRMRMSIEDRVKILKDSLNLSDDQATKITKLLEDQREEITTLRNEHKGERKALQSTMQNLMKKTDEGIKAVLTEEQSKKYSALIKDRRERIGRRLRGSGK